MFKRCILVFILVCLFTPFLEAQDQNAQSSDQQINDFSVSGFGDKGKKTWDLNAKSADIFTDTIKLKDITGNIYREKEDIKIDADRGDFDKVEGKVHLEQNVVITTSSGAKLTTDSLDWDRKNEVVSTKEMVNIEKENLFTTAYGAVAKPDLNKVTLDKDVTVRIKPASSQGEPAPADEDKTIITCDGPLEIDYKENLAIFKNNVKVDRKDIQIYCDIMDVYFIMSDKPTDKAAGESDKAPTVMGSQINKIVAKGNVKINRGDNISYSDEAIYSALDKKITLLGKPKLIIYSTEDFNASIGD